MNSENKANASSGHLLFREGIRQHYPDVLTPEALDALEALAGFNAERRRIMDERIARRTARFREGRRIGFLDPAAVIPRTALTVQQAREGKFEGSEIPPDLQRQWIQGTGPATRPRSTLEAGIRNVAYALLSGADGWMFDGEDALGQVDSMSLDNLRNLKIAFERQEPFLRIAETVAAEMNAWGRGFFGREIIADWKKQLDFTTRIFRPRGLHLDDRHVRDRDGSGFSASIVDAALYVVNTHRTLRAEGRSIVLYLPKIQTAEEAALWHDILCAVEQHAGLSTGTIKTYVLVEQLEACYQLMEIRAALGRRFVGFNTGRWDYINSVADALAWDKGFHNPNIDAVTMKYGYMRIYEDRVRRAVNTPDRNGNFALWQGGMQPNIPVGSEKGIALGMKRALAGGESEQKGGASGKVGGALEDGPHRPADLGEGRGGQPTGPRLPAAHLQPTGCRRPDPARTRAAHGARGPRPDFSRAAVRQRLRPRLPGRGAQAGGLLRQRRRALSDGGHGHGRDSLERSLGVAAQGRPLHGRRSGQRHQGRRSVHARIFRAADAGGIRETAQGGKQGRPRRLEGLPRCRSPAKSSRATSRTRSRRPGASTCSTST